MLPGIRSILGSLTGFCPAGFEWLSRELSRNGNKEMLHQLSGLSFQTSSTNAYYKYLKLVMPFPSYSAFQGKVDTYLLTQPCPVYLLSWLGWRRSGSLLLSVLREVPNVPRSPVTASTGLSGSGPPAVFRWCLSALTAHTRLWNSMSLTSCGQPFP